MIKQRAEFYRDRYWSEAIRRSFKNSFKKLCSQMKSVNSHKELCCYGKQSESIKGYVVGQKGQYTDTLTCIGRKGQ